MMQWKRCLERVPRLAPVALASMLLAAGVPASVTAQRSPGLIRLALQEQLPPALPDVVCIEVRPQGAEGSRDVARDEIPEGLPRSVRVVGASECDRHRAGARHRLTGAQALIVRLQVGGQPALGEAWFTYGWYRDGSNAGSVRCAVSRQAGQWEIGECRLLWTATPEGQSVERVGEPASGVAAVGQNCTPTMTLTLCSMPYSSGSRTA